MYKIDSNGKMCVISVYCGGGLWFSVCLPPLPLSSSLIPLSVQLVSRFVSSGQFRWSVGLFVLKD